METILQNSYEHFLCFLFENQESDEDWRFDFSEQELALSNPQLLQYILRMFENYETDMAHFSDWQIAKGVEFIFSSTFSDWAFIIRDGPGQMADRLKVIQGLKSFYKQCLDKRCAPTLGHYSEKGNPLNYLCYMLWDITPLSYCEGRKDKDILYQAVTGVLEYTLQLENKACVESGLHGLGHLTLFYPQAASIIEQNMPRFGRIDHRLLSYAKAAKTGCIL